MRSYLHTCCNLYLSIKVHQEQHRRILVVFEAVMKLCFSRSGATLLARSRRRHTSGYTIKARLMHVSRAIRYMPFASYKCHPRSPRIHCLFDQNTIKNMKTHCICMGSRMHNTTSQKLRETHQHLNAAACRAAPLIVLEPQYIKSGPLTSPKSGCTTM